MQRPSKDTDTVMSNQSILPPDSDDAATDARPVERAYEGIRRRILEGALRPGDHLGEEQLAVLTRTSRTPVREALRRLVSEGLIITGPNRRNYVAEFDPAEVDAVFEIRVRLESYAAELACKRINDAELARLTELADRIEGLGPEVSNRSLADFLELNNTFHEVILGAAGSRQLALAAATAIAIPLALLKHYVWEAPVNIVRSNEQHREIIAALTQRNAHWAGHCMAAHINSTRPIATRWKPPTAERLTAERPAGRANDLR
jgi:DNA-binding GntR family transcriptional regulator